MDLTTAQRMVHIWRLKSDRIVFTNGCFDILRRGHVESLEEAASRGDRLIIGLNSDTSVIRQGKGPGRPVNDQHARAKVLAALRCVDAVVIFDTDTPLELITMVMPDVLVKGGDWKLEQIVGGEFVRSHGGEVRSLKLVEGHSTTGLISRIKHG